MGLVSLRVVTLPEARAGEAAALAPLLAERAAALPGVQGGWAAVSPAGTINAGHLVLRLTHPSEGEAIRLPITPGWAEAIAPLLDGALVETIGFRPAHARLRRRGPGVWRALVFGLLPGARPEQVAALEAALLRMPAHVAAIRGWSLSPVAFCEGPKRYGLVWEQEFDDLAGLTGPYMTDPVHWAHVDAWFDADHPDYIVDPQLIHVHAAISRSILSGRGV